VLINLLPEFLEILSSPHREAAYRRYLDAHRAVLSAYWNNYVLDLGSPHADEVIGHALRADRTDLRALLQSVSVTRIAEEALFRAEELLQLDRPADCYLMVGLGAANAGELVVNGRGIVFVCLEHFTGRLNPTTYGLGLSPDLIAVWIAHELAHVARYTSPASRSAIRRLIEEEGGYYSYWNTGSRATLRELLVNEGLAVHASRAVAPGFPMADYFGYQRRQFQRMRELEGSLRRAAHHDLDRCGLGLRLRFLSGGMSPTARLALGRVLPERSGYYLGYRMTEAIVAQHGIAAALRAPAAEFEISEEVVRDIRTA